MTLQLKPKRVVLDMSATDYLRILGGPPESVSIRSGLVVLKACESVGRHSTGSFEEMLVVLEGDGEMIFSDGSVMQLSAHTVAYCPPETEHDVRNSGKGTLRYIYMVAKALWQEDENNG